MRKSQLLVGDNIKLQVDNGQSKLTILKDTVYAQVEIKSTK